MKKFSTFILVLILIIVFCSCDIGKVQSENVSQNTSKFNPSSKFSTTPEASTSETISIESSPEGQSTEPAPGYEITDCRAKTWTNSIGTVWVQTIVEITNTGTTNLYLSSGSYDLEDASGTLIASKTMVSTYPSVLAPGEKGYMYEETILDDTTDGELIVLPREDIEEAKVELIRFPVTDTKISNGTYGKVKMTGRIENTSNETQNFVYIVAFLYDDNGACIGQIFTILTEDLAAGDKIGFEMSSLTLPDDVSAESIADYVIYAYPLQYQF